MPNCDILKHSYYYNVLIYRYIFSTLPHHYSSDAAFGNYVGKINLT